MSKKAGRWKRYPAFAGAAILGSAIAVSSVMAASAPFKDMKGHWANQSVQLLHERGVISGFPDGTFKPGNSVSKAEFFTMLNKAMAFTATQSPSFSDVSKDSWYYSEVSKAIAAGYIQGEYKDGGALQPKQAITRQEAASMIMKALKLQPSADMSTLKSSKFKDEVQMDEWRKAAIDTILAKNIMGGFPDQTFKPKDKVTRAQIAVIMNRVYNVNGAAGSQKATNSDNTGTVTFLPINPITVMQYQSAAGLVPKSVGVKYANGNQAMVPVTWDRQIDTGELGKYTLLGTVGGVSEKAELVVFVVSNSAQTGNNNTGNTGGSGGGGTNTNIPTPTVPSVTDGQAIGNVKVNFSTLMSTVEIDVSNKVTSVKANGNQMHYEGNNKYSFATAGLKLGDKITIIAYDIKGSVVQKYETTVQQTNN